MKTIRKLYDICCRDTKLTFFIFWICSTWISYYSYEITSSNWIMSFFERFLTFVIFSVNVNLDFSVVASYVVKYQRSTAFSYGVNTTCNLNYFVEEFTFFCDVFVFLDEFWKTDCYLEFMRERIFSGFYFF